MFYNHEVSCPQSQWSLNIHLSNLLQIIRLLTGNSVLHVPLQQTLHTMVSNMPGIRVPSVSCVWQHPESMLQTYWDLYLHFAPFIVSVGRQGTSPQCSHSPGPDSWEPPLHCTISPLLTFMY